MAIVVSGLRKVYPGGKVALDGIDLTISGTFGLLGPNGAGKTTLMRILATLIPPTAGSVTIDGIPITDVAAIRRRLGYLPQKFGFYPQLTVYETMEFMAALAQVPADRGRLMALLERVGLADRAGARVRQLSGGMVQRLGIATALIGDPRVLIVDEPTAGLDHHSRVGFRNLLAGLTGDRTVLFSTHIVSDVETTCSRLAVLREGRVIFTGTPGELAAAAEGHVWTVAVDPPDWTQFETRFRPVAAVREAGRVRARLVAPSPPPGYAAEPAAPTLEDGYIHVLRCAGSGGTAV
ncbi:MAG: ATP-binding cassette domain-containing protein [Clostridiales bacterium]|nr:ATP-binding cassette domain-containing protein [Clostridiales bacterium]